MEALVVKISLLILCIVCITSKEDKRTSWKGIFNRVPTSEAAKFVLSRSPIGQDERESLSLCRDIRRRRREFQHQPGVLEDTTSGQYSNHRDSGHRHKNIRPGTRL